MRKRVTNRWQEKNAEKDSSFVNIEKENEALVDNDKVFSGDHEEKILINIKVEDNEIEKIDCNNSVSNSIKMILYTPKS